MKLFLIAAVVVAVTVASVASCANSDSYKKEMADRAERARRESIPHVVREADGCKVYAFKSGDLYHFFTRCPDSRTSTESSWDECRQSGKSRVCETKSENIEVTK